LSALSKIHASVYVSACVRARFSVHHYLLIESVINCTLHLLKDQPEDGPTIGPKHVAGIIT